MARPPRYRWGMYSGDVMYVPARDLFVTLHEQHIAKPVQSSTISIFDGIRGTSLVPPDQFRRYYDALKLYVMMGGSQSDRGSLGDVRDWCRHGRRQSRMPNPSRKKWRPIFDTTFLWSSVVRLPHGNRMNPYSYACEKCFYAHRVWNACTTRWFKVPMTRLLRLSGRTSFMGAVAPFVTSRAEKVVQGAYTKEGWLRIRKLLTAQQSRLVDEGWGSWSGARTCCRRAKQANRGLKNVILFSVHSDLGGVSFRYGGSST